MQNDEDNMQDILYEIMQNAVRLPLSGQQILLCISKNKEMLVDKNNIAFFINTLQSNL